MRLARAFVVLLLLGGLAAGCGGEEFFCGSGGECWVCPNRASYDLCCGLLFPVRPYCEQVCVAAPPDVCGF